MTMKESEFPSRDFYRTNDMAMVTFLKVSGHPVQHVSWEADTCYWLFRITAALLSQIDQFLSGEARIEPREYNKVFNTTKREFYDTNPKNTRPLSHHR